MLYQTPILIKSGDGTVTITYVYVGVCVYDRFASKHVTIEGQFDAVTQCSKHSKSINARFSNSGTNVSIIC